MLEDLIEFYKNEVGYINLVSSHLSFWQKVLMQLHFIYLIVMFSTLLLFFKFLVLGNPWGIVPILLIGLDLYLMSKKRKSFIGGLLSKQSSVKLEIFKKKNKKVKVIENNFYKTFSKYRELKLKKHLKGYHVGNTLEALKHKENSDLKKFYFSFGALALIVSKYLDRIIVRVPLFKKFDDLLVELIYFENKGEEGYMYAISAFTGLFFLVAFSNLIILHIPNLFVVSFIDIKFRRVIYLRKAIENILIKENNG